MLKKFFSETVLYGLSTVLIRLINYALVPLHTGVFEPDNYGIISWFYAYAVAFNVIYSYGMETTYFRFTSNLEKEEQRKVGDRILTTLFITSIIFSSILYFNAENIATNIGFNNASQFVHWFAMLLAIDALLIIPFAKLRVENRPLKFAGLKLIEVILTVGLNYFFLKICPSIMKGDYLSNLQPFIQKIYDPTLGIGYAFLANLISKAIMLILVIKSFLTWRPRLEWKIMKRYYSYGLPLLVTGLAAAINEVADRELLERLLPEGFYGEYDSMYSVGIYSACYKLSIFITLAVTAFKYAAEPFFFAQASNKKSPELFATVMHYFVIALIVMMVGVCLNVDWLADIFLKKPEYKVGLSIVPFLFLANVFLGIYYNLSVWFKVTDRTYMGTFISIGGAIITLSLNFTLIPVIGYHGSAIATLCCYASMATASYLLGQKYYPIPYHIKNAIIHITLGIITVALGFMIQLDDFWTRFLTQNLLLLSYLGIVLVLERKKIKGLLKKKNR